MGDAMKKRFGFIYLALVALTILFQVAAIAGAPLSSFTQGGVLAGELSPAGKANAAVSVLLLLVFALIVARKAQILPAKAGSRLVDIGFWCVLVFSVLETLLNWLTPSDLERALWGPVNTVLLVCVIGIARLSRRK